MAQREWTIREMEVLERYYCRMTVRELRRKYFPYRTASSIMHKASMLGVRKFVPNFSSSFDAWSEEDVEILERHYPECTAGQIRERFFPDRSEISIRTMARTLARCERKIEFNYFTSDELDILRREYPKGGCRRMRELLPHRTVSAICQKARMEGLKYTPTGDGDDGAPWSREELQLLEKAHLLSAEQAAKLFPHRSPGAVAHKRRRIGWQGGKQCWTGAELCCLREHMEEPLDELCRYLPKRSRSAIISMRLRLRNQRS